jgi:hypothetical protein
MQVGAPLQATRVKHMRSRLRRPRSRAVVDGQRKFSRSVLVQCALYWEDHGWQLMAHALCGIARAGLYDALYKLVRYLIGTKSW